MRRGRLFILIKVRFSLGKIHVSGKGTVYRARLSPTTPVSWHRLMDEDLDEMKSHMQSKQKASRK